MAQMQAGNNKLWVVFDRDSFKPNAFNGAIQTCRNKTPKVEAAWTNEAFELWYLLHFHYYNTGINREKYQNLIEGNFKRKGLKNYELLIPFGQVKSYTDFCFMF